MSNYNNLDKSSEERSPWHSGELHLQHSIGKVDTMRAIGQKVIRRYMPEQHREFYAQLPFALFGVVDPQDRPWATLLAAHSGFLHTPTQTNLQVHTHPTSQDPAYSGFREGFGVGMLGIELHTRRRNRMNGYISQLSEYGFEIQVEQTMGNCPKYIQLRTYSFVEDSSEILEQTPQHRTSLEPKDIAMIQAADSFYVATYVESDAHHHVDVSHRGGKSGFVRIDDEGVLTIPDFVGNAFFNTLGNIVVTGKAGLLFVDYESGDVLQLTGSAEVHLDSEESTAFKGAERFWSFKPTQLVRRSHALPIRWTLEEMSPYVLDKGSWEEVKTQRTSVSSTGLWRPLRVSEIVEESTVIRSLYLEPDSPDLWLDYEAGQHLPIRVMLTEQDKKVKRNYTLSSAPSEQRYRISVRRDGLVSTYLHDQIQVGDVIEAARPQGAFTFDLDETRPAVMLAGGVGITPMISMLRELVSTSEKRGQMRSVWLFQASHNSRERAFDDEIHALMTASKGTIRRIRAESSGMDDPNGTYISEQRPSSTPSIYDRHHKGRIDIALLRSVLPFDDFDFYLCGPPGFEQSLYDGLRDMGIRDKRIFSESFGSIGLKRKKENTSLQKSVKKASKEAVKVLFSKSGKSALWTPEQGSLLELAERCGLEPPSLCREGHCGTCQVKFSNRSITYEKSTDFRVKTDRALICCAVPAQEQEGESTQPLVLEL